jgi:hypothetical protein
MFFASWIKDAIGPHLDLVLLLAVATILGAGIAQSLLTGQQSGTS